MVANYSLATVRYQFSLCKIPTINHTYISHRQIIDHHHCLGTCDLVLIVHMLKMICVVLMNYVIIANHV